jgi:hypothetical protein
VPSSAACRTHWEPTPEAHPDSFRELAGPSVSLVCSSKPFRLEVQVLISDYLCVVRSRHGCNVRCHRIHCCEPTGDAGCAKWRGWWLRSRFFGWYQRCALFQFLVHFCVNILCSSFSTDSSGFMCGYWGRSGDVRYCRSIITRRSGGTVI